MTSNEERREIAAKLRELADENTVTATDYFVREIFKELGVEPPATPSYPTLGDLEAYDQAFLYRLADLIEPEPERTCLVLCVKHGPVFDVLRFSCCGYEWAENRTDRGATEPDPNYCPNCGAKVVDE